MPIARFSLLATLAVSGYAQTVASSGSLPLSATQVHRVAIPTGQTVSLPFIHDATAGGGDLLHIRVSDALVAVSLTLPGGAVITDATASANGFGWVRHSVTRQTEGLTPVFGDIGHHHSITFPANLVSGTYTLQFSSAPAPDGAAAAITLLASSRAQFGVTMSKQQYVAGDQPVILAAVSNGGPVSGATVRAYVWRRDFVSSIQLTNFAQVASAQLTGYRELEYSFSVQNSGPELAQVSALAVNSAVGVEVRTGQLYLGRIPGSTTTAVTSRLMVRVRDGVTFAPASLEFAVDSAGPEQVYTLSDTGLDEAGTAGDGIYAVALPAVTAGEYFVRLDATASAGGASFVRHSLADFTVVPLYAKFGSSPVTETATLLPNGKLQKLTFTIPITVTVAGSYSVTMMLTGPNGTVSTSEAGGTLGTGAQSLSMEFTAGQLVPLASDGPWQREHLVLHFSDAEGSKEVDRSWSFGSTGVYPRANLDRGTLYPTGNATATGIDRDGTGKFDILRVQLPVVTPGGNCDWGANLYVPASTTRLQMAGGQAVLPAGAAVISIDFNGNLIAQSGLDGPYELSSVSISCDSTEAGFPESFPIIGFTASQFRNIAKALTLQLSSNTIAVPRGGSAQLVTTVGAQGGLAVTATLSLNGAPAGVTGSFSPGPAVFSGDFRRLTVSAPAGQALGSFPAQVLVAKDAYSASAPLTIQIVPGSDFTLTSNPPSAFPATAAPGGQTALTLTVTPAVASAGTVTFSIAGLPAGATSGFSPGSISGGGSTLLTLAVATNTPAGTYPLIVTAGNGEVTKTLPISLIVDPLALPYPWSPEHVGVPATGASIIHGNGVFTLSGPGSFLAGTSDVYHWAKQPVTGDGMLVARVSRLQNAGRAGIMIRESAAFGAPGIFLGWTNATTIALQSRAAHGAAWAVQTTAARTIPTWLRLERVGNTFIAATSIDGVRWTTFGTSIALTLPSTAVAGLAVVSETTGAAVVADFDHAVVSTVTAPGFYLSDPSPVSRTTGPGSLQASYAFTSLALNSYSGVTTPTVSGLPAGATAQFAAATVAAGSGTVLTVTNNTATPGTYPLTITATSGSLTQRTYATLIIGTTPPALPDPWTSQTIGAATAGNGVTVSNGVHTVSGGGTGIDATADAFQFDAAYLAGDGDVTARILSITNPITNGRAGVMIRDEATPGAPFAFAGLTRTASTYQLEFLTRATAGIAPVIETGPVATLPASVRVTRTGNSFTAAWSADGVTWTALGTAKTIAMPALVLAGAAVTSRDQAQLMTATFDNLRVGGSTDFALALLPPARSIPAAAAVYYHTVRMGNAGGTAGTAALSIAGLPSGVTASFSAPSITAGSVSNLQLTVAAGVAPGTYPLTVTATGTVTRAATLTLTVTAGPAALPLPWTADDIGSANLPGTSVITPANINIQASGNRLYGNTDAFRYTYRALTGDGTIQIRGNTWSTIWDGARIGVMIRDSLAPDATYATARLRADVLVGTLIGIGGGVQSRTAYGAASTETETQGVGLLPYSVRIARLGNVFTAHGSLDGITWQQMGQSVNISMPPTVFIGYAVSSGNDNGLTTVGFDSPVFAIGPDFYLQSQQSTNTVPAGTGTAYYNVSVNPFNGFNGTVTLSTPGLPAGLTATWLPASLTPGITRLTIKSSPAIIAGTYPITLSATDGTLTRTTTVNLVVDGATATPPAPWSYDFVGAGVPSGPFGVTAAAGVFEFTAPDCCVAGTSDKFLFLHQPLAADGSVSARLTAVPSAPGVAGLMIRNTLDPASPFLAVSYEGPTATLRIESRASQGGAVVTVANAASLELGPIATWLRLVRAGSTITVFGSHDGVQWIPISTPLTLTLAASTEAGMFAAGGSATFNAASTVTQTAPVLSAFPARAFSMNSQSAAYHLQWFPAGGTFPGTPVFTVSGLPANVTAAFTDPVFPDSSRNSAGVFAKTLTLTAAAAATPGPYSVTAIATLGAVSVSAPVNLTVGPGFNIGPPVPSFGPVVATSAGFYAKPNSPGGIANAYAFTSPITYIGGYTERLYMELRDDLSDPPDYSHSTIPSQFTASGPLLLTLRAHPAKITTGMHRLRVIAQTQDGSTRIEQSIPLELGPYFDAIGASSNFTEQTVPSGSQRDYPVILRRWYGLSEAVTFAPENLPAGVSLSLTPNPAPPVTANPTGFTDQSLVLTVTAAPSTVQGVYNTIQLRASSDTMSRASAWPVRVTGSLQLAATPASSAIAPAGSATYTVTLTLGSGTNTGPYIFSALGLPAGATASFSPPDRSNTGATAMTIVTTAATPLGTYPIVIRATNDNSSANFFVNSAPVNLVIEPPSYTVTATAPVTVNAGSSTTSTVTVAPMAGFSGPVTLSASGLPAGATASFATNPVNTSGTSVMTLATTGAVLGGVYTVTITGTNGAFAKTTTVTLTVRAFTLSAAPAVQSIPIGGTTAAYVTTLTMVQSYNQTTTFSATGLPAGATAAFSPTTRTTTGNTNLTIATTTATPEGTHSFNIVATGPAGAPVRTFPATLTVTPNFSVSAAGGVTAVAGASGTAQVTVTASPGITGATSLAVTAGLPAGATASFAPATITGTGNTTLTVAATAATVGGTYTLTVTATNGATTRTTTLTLTIQSFTLTASPASRTIARGANTTYTLTLTMQGGFNSSVAFSATGLPAGTTAAFSPATRTSTGTSTATITTTSTTPRATHSITLRAINGGITKTVTVTLIVN